ncbi:MAG TPA: hypothetical protein V6C52_12305 [Coleofasciculaceae cyanobacterium]|jgi:hypothetical protein
MVKKQSKNPNRNIAPPEETGVPPVERERSGRDKFPSESERNREYLAQDCAGHRVGIPIETEPPSEIPPGLDITDFLNNEPHLPPRAGGDFTEDVSDVDQVGDNGASWMRNASYDRGAEVKAPSYKINEGGRRMGGPTGGDFIGGGGGPEIGETHSATDEDVLKIGSPQETQAALEHKVASENYRQQKQKR